MGTLTAAPAPAVPARALLRVWAGIGLQSFGGGASTQLLIRRAFVEQRDWISAEELARMWNLCLFTPGINLVSLTVLIGRRLGGARGVAASLAGMLLPSGMVTCMLAAGFMQVRQNAAVHAVLRGVIPATAGIMLVVGLGFAQPLLRRARDDGSYALALHVAMIASGTLALAWLKLPVAAVVLVAALLGALLFTPWRQSRLASPGGWRSSGGGATRDPAGILPPQSGPDGGTPSP